MRLVFKNAIFLLIVCFYFYNYKIGDIPKLHRNCMVNALILFKICKYIVSEIWEVINILEHYRVGLFF